MLINKSFDAVVDEIFSMSPTSPFVTNKAVNLLKTYYRENTIMVSDDFPEIKEALYSIEDHQMYTIFSLCFEDVYSYHLMLAKKVMPFDVLTNIIGSVKEELELTGPEIGELYAALKEPIFVLSEVLKSSTRTSRRAIGFGINEIPLPDMDELKTFYECGRKASYVTQQEAEKVAEGQKENAAYKCPHCGLYHQGRPPTGDKIADEIMLSRYVTAWRRYHKI